MKIVRGESNLPSRPMCKECGHVLAALDGGLFGCTECGAKFDRRIAVQLINLREFSSVRAIFILLCPSIAMALFVFYALVISHSRHTFLLCSVLPLGMVVAPISWVYLFGKYLPSCYGAIPSIFRSTYAIPLVIIVKILLIGVLTIL